MPEPVELTRLREALEQFEARKPRDLSESLTGAIDGLKEALTQGDPSGRASPGARAAQAVAYAGGTGVALKDAAKGEDKPSPGQEEASPGRRQAQNLSAEIQQAAQRIVQEHQQTKDQAAGPRQ